MEKPKCAKCGETFDKWVEFCPGCSEPMEGYSRPAGFWIRVGASLIDTVIFLPLGLLNFWNMFAFKNMALLIVLSVPGFLYKPLMEAFCGATLGKMSCKLKVIDKEGKKLSVFYAYVRAFPFLLASGVGVAGQVILFSSPAFQEATSMVEFAQAQKQGTFLDAVSPLINLFVLVECIFAAFTYRKRALHDMLADSYCVYKEPSA